MRLVIRADTSVNLGTGHLMRCLALGQAWQDAGGVVELITRSENTALLKRAHSEKFLVRLPGGASDWPALEEAAQGEGPAALVLDGYDFDPEYQRRARQMYHPLVVIDDMAHQPGYAADLILNQNIYADQLAYNVEPYTRLLRGCKWALFRREFRSLREWSRVPPREAHNLLVTLGGADADNVTLRVLEAIGQSALPDDFEVVAVVGSENPHMRTLEEVVARWPHIKLLSNVENMASLMTWADLAVLAAGSTCWEAAFLGLPSMVLVLADNQEANALGIAAAGAAVNMGRQEDLLPAAISSALERIVRDGHALRSLGEHARALTSGNGAEAVVSEIVSLF